MKNLNSVSAFLAKSTTEAKQDAFVQNGVFKRSKSSLLMLFIALFSFAYSFGQTTLISPTGDGGFQNGSTFAANGWTVSNSANNPWIVAPLSNGAISGNAAFISSDGTTPSYTNNAISSNYFYRDITVPAGQAKIKLDFDWIANGESTWDLWQVFVAPTSITPTGTTVYPSSGANNVPAGIVGASFVANGNLQTTIQSASVFLPASLAGTTFRLIFHWKNDGSGGTTPPAQIDNISLVSSLPGDYISITSGNWGTPSTWDANAVPGVADNVTISTGHTVTVDGNNQGANNAVVNGTIVYGATPTILTVGGNLTVNTGGLVNVFSGTTGKTITVSGNIINNGTIDLSVGATTTGNLTLNGATVQTVSGSGTFNTGVIRNLIFSNTNTATPNINWSFNNVKVAYNLSLTGARVNLGTNKLTFGNNAAGNTLTAPVGTGFLPGGKFSRYWTATATGTALVAGTDPSNVTSRYPFIDLLGQNRAMYITRTNATGAVAGELAVTYNDGTTLTSGLSILDGSYTVTDRYNGNWSVSNEGTAVSASSYSLALIAQNAYVAGNGNSRIIAASAAISGTHQNGTVTPGAQRTAVTQADLLAGPLYIGISSSDIPNTALASGNWNDPTIWDKGNAPTCSDPVSIPSGIDVTVNTTGNVAKGINILAGGTLTVTSGDLLVGCTMNNSSLIVNGTFTVSGGIVTINGNLLSNIGSTVNQSGGEILVDGNDNGIVANSVPAGTSLVRFIATTIPNLNLTGGKITIIDPHAGTSTSDYAFVVSQSGGSSSATTAHTVQFGNGVSTTAGGATNGFYVYLWQGSNYYSFGNVNVEALTGTNRFVKTTGTIGILGNLTIASGEYLLNSTTYIAGNLVNNGTLTATSTLNLATWIGTATASANPQTISGSGVFRNSLTTTTANLLSLTVNNTNATGVTLNVPLSVSGTLTMTSGLINTTNTNLLTLGTATAAGTLSGTPTASNMVKGPFARTIGTNNTAFIVFPVGKSVYSPISLAPTTTAVSVMKAEAFDVNAGTADAAIMNLSTTNRWEASAISGTFTDMKVRLGAAGLVAANIPVQAPSAAGIYTSSFGSVAVFATGTPNTIEATNALDYADFTGFISYAESNVCSGTPTPGTTIASASTICLGESVSLSVLNATVGTGVSYQWKSSTDGITYTAIAGATNLSTVVTPTTTTYYILDVTCATGPATGSSTPIQVGFASNVTATTAATRCGTGSVTLTATPNAGATINWFNTNIGGTSIGSGNSFTTPSISATTTFYASANEFSNGTATLGAGATTSTSTGNTFFPGGWGGAKTQYIIRASELVAAGVTAGNITNLGFETTTSGQTYQGFTVQIGATAATEMTTSFITSGLAQVYLGTETDDGYTPAANALNNLAFGTGTGSASSFNWDGTSNVVISISWSRVPSASTATASSMKVDNVGFNSTGYRQRDQFTPAAMLAEISANTPTQFRPQFTINGVVICSGERMPVVATVTAPPTLTLSGASTAICNGQSTAAVTVTAGSTDYDSYVWSPTTGVSGNAASGFIFNPTVTTTYTLTASQSAGALCATTANYLVNVNPLPSAIVITPATASVCTDGIQQLTATGGTIGIVGKVGSGTTSSGITTPFKGGWGGSKTQSLYTAAELTALGMEAGQKISSIGWVAISGTNTPMSGFTISAGFVAPNTLGTAFIAGATNTVLAPVVYTPNSPGNIDFTLSNPLLWDGVSNLLIETCFNNNNSGTGSSIAVECTTVTGLALYKSQDNAADVCSNTVAPSTSTSRPNLRISTLENTEITWSPIAGLFTDAAATVAYVAGTETATVYAKSATAGSFAYTATGTNSATSCTASATANVTVNAITANTTTVAECDTYTWAENGTTYTVSGTYTSVTGCNTETLQLTITPSSTNTTTVAECDTYTWAENGTTYTASGTYTSVTGCNTEVLELTITPSSTNTTTVAACDTYTWAENGTVYTTSGTYTSVTGCETEVLELTINTTPVATITRSGDDLNVNATAGATYQWVKCDGSFTPITGATNASYLAIEAGSYAVEVTVNGCMVTSACFDVTTLGVKAIDVANMNLYPNPVSDALTITYTKNITGVQLFDLTGRLIQNIITNTNEVSVDMSEMPAAIYIVKVIAENTTSEFRVVKN
ncbi:MAG: T9SS type A sorting domain-containing protein [Crocinitomicaceae bacterium]|nr:T9SS type A sorting domain-containing protein [Crocinitomicaceae bacterium]